MTQERQRASEKDTVYVIVAKNAMGTWVKNDKVYYTLEEAVQGLEDVKLFWVP